jgi:ubiquinone/menaquinone biosynthesis C-methylase UbiE
MTDFDELARRYDAWYATPLGAWADQHETEAVFRLLEPRPGERLLDLGTGTGRYAQEAARRGARVVGIDPSPGMLAVARGRVAGQPVDLICAGAARLPFPDRSFDAILAMTSLCFVSDPVAVLREAARMLKPGGRLVLGELNRWSLWALVRRIEGLFHQTTYRAAWHWRATHPARGERLRDHALGRDAPGAATRQRRLSPRTRPGRAARAPLDAALRRVPCGPGRHVGRGHRRSWRRSSAPVSFRRFQHDDRPRPLPTARLRSSSCNE